MPFVTLDRVDQMLGGLDGSRLLVLGASYRGGVADTRHSPSAAFAAAATARGAEVVCHDPLVTEWELPVAPVQELPDPAGFDVVVFAVVHDDYLAIDLLGWLGDSRPDRGRRQSRAARQPASRRRGPRLPCLVHRSRGRSRARHASGDGRRWLHRQPPRPTPARRRLVSRPARRLLPGRQRCGPARPAQRPEVRLVERDLREPGALDGLGPTSSRSTSPPSSAWPMCWSGPTRRCATTPHCW